MLQLNFTPFPVLTTERLMLRKLTVDDAPEMFFLRADPEVLKFIDREPAKSVVEAIEFINMVNKILETNEGITWAIVQKGSPKIIGNICFWNVQKDNCRAELGYVLHPDWQGMGIMTEAVQSVLKYGFSVMKLHSIEAHVHPANCSSVRVLERNGFVREAYFRENYYFRGQFLDSAVYSLLSPLP